MTVITTKPNWLTQTEILYRVVNQPEVKEDFNIKQGDFHFLRGDHRWEIISCAEGMIWITQKNDLKDYVLKSGQALLITNPGLVSIKGLKDSQIQISPTLQTPPYKGKLLSFP